MSSSYSHCNQRASGAAVTDVDAARQVVEALGARLKADPGAAFEDDLISALAVLKEHDAAAWARARAEFRRYGVSVRDVERAIRQLRRPGLQLVTPEQAATDRTVGAMLGDDCPLSELIVPSDYQLDPDTTIEHKENVDPLTGECVVEHHVVAHAPVPITGRLRDVEEGTESFELAYLRPGSGWNRAVVDRRVALDHRRVIEAAATGFPVASTSASDLVRYLAEFEAQTFTAIPVSQVAGHLGWQGRDGELGFLVGPQLILPDGSVEAVGEAGAGLEAPALIGFRGLAPGDEQIARALRAQGTLDGWLRGMKLAQQYPRALVAVYAAFVPPVLRILRAPNFILDWANRTSTGKTSVLRLGASVWGNPNEQEPESLVWSWDATTVFIERASSILHSLPVFLDESQRARDGEAVARLLYEAAHGRGRARGNIRGVSRTRTWNTVMLSTGEMPLVSFTTDAGTRARCLEVRGCPFGAANQQTAQLVSHLNCTIRTNYGHAGPWFVQWLMRNRDRWPYFERDYHDCIAPWSRAVSDGQSVDPAIVDRHAQYFAALEVAATCVHYAFDLPWFYRDPLESLWDEIVADSSEAATDKRAMRDVVSWAHSHSAEFFGREVRFPDGGIRVPPGGWAGRWDKGEGWAWIGFYPTVLQKVLRDCGYRVEAVFQGWKQRGWLDTGQNSNYHKRVRVQDDNPYLIVIRREAINEAE